MNTDKVNLVGKKNLKKITFVVGRITQYMAIKLVFTLWLWSLNKGEMHSSKLQNMEENEDASS